jgi:uncharacterized protein YecE (DUF72 family)
LKERLLPIIATAGWSIPQVVSDRFSQEGSGLERYASVFDGVEVNSTFYRNHRLTTFERWAAAVPDHFRFAIKLPRTITHDLRLREIGGPFQTFLEMIAPLGKKLGPLLCQLPPSLDFDQPVVEQALADMREVHSGAIFIEARHRSWHDDEVLPLLEHYGAGRVLADPPVVWNTSDFKEPPGYVRLHGKPKVYYSDYNEAEIASLSAMLAQDTWCVFDNTASGAAVGDALAMLKKILSHRPA